MDTFGNAQAKVIPLDLSENQFQIYNKISRNYSHSFLFESLSGPEVLAETSVMGFDPKIIFKGYSDKVEIIENNEKSFGRCTIKLGPTEGQATISIEIRQINKR